jgi:hypothetical protein
MQAIGMCINSNALKPLFVLMSETARGHKSIGLITSAALQQPKERRVQRCVMNCIGLGIWATTAAQKNALPLSEQDHAHHAMKTVTKDATVQQEEKLNDPMQTPLAVDPIATSHPVPLPMRPMCPSGMGYAQRETRKFFTNWVNKKGPVAPFLIPSCRGRTL